MRVLACVVMLFVICTSMAPAAPDSPPAIDAKKASLAEALDDWIALLEKDNPDLASSRWTKDEQAAKGLKQWWNNLKEANKKFHYRDWLEKHGDGGGAKKIGDAKAFKVGGHAFGHMHTDWEKTDEGWRIVKVWMCR